MKSNLKKLFALLLAAMFALSLTGLGEEEIVIEDGDVTIDETSTDILFPDEADMAAQLDEPELSIPDLVLEAPEAEGTIAPEAITEDEATPNALVKKVVIGVKERYTIDTSSLKGKLTFTSAKPTIATVTKKGVIVGKKAGTTKVVITTSNKKKYSITVVVAKAPSNVKLNKTKATLEIGDTLKLKAVLPKKTASKKMTWTSSNKGVATVNQTGTVTARAEGTATITVKTFNGKKATCKVTVNAPAPTPEPTPEPTSQPGYSGDIWDAIGSNFDVFNNAIDDPLVLYSYEADYIVYINNYMMVTVSYKDNSILTIMLSSGDSNGKYTINDIYPGYNLVTCKMMAEYAGWTYWKTESNSEGYRYFYRASYKGRTIYLVLLASGNQGSSNVNNVAIMCTE